MTTLFRGQESSWDSALEPVGNNTSEKEEFFDWHARNYERLSHIHPQIAEQWIYRHWGHSPFEFLPIEKISWSLSSMTVAEFFDQVHMEFGGPAAVEHDIRVFTEGFGNKAHPTVASFQTHQTWFPAPMALKTPNGILSENGKLPKVRLVLVEGHLRYRYMYAHWKNGQLLRERHDLFVIEAN